MKESNMRSQLTHSNSNFLSYTQGYDFPISTDGSSMDSPPLLNTSCAYSKAHWTKIEQQAFASLKEAFTTALVLLHRNLHKSFQVDTDASDYAIGAVLS